MRMMARRAIYILDVRHRPSFRLVYFWCKFHQHQKQPTTLYQMCPTELLCHDMHLLSASYLSEATTLLLMLTLVIAPLWWLLVFAGLHIWNQQVRPAAQHHCWCQRREQVRLSLVSYRDAAAVAVAASVAAATPMLCCDTNALLRVCRIC